MCVCVHLCTAMVGQEPAAGRRAGNPGNRHPRDGGESQGPGARSPGLTWTQAVSNEQRLLPGPQAHWSQLAFLVDLERLGKVGRDDRLPAA